MKKELRSSDRGRGEWKTKSVSHKIHSQHHLQYLTTPWTIVEQFYTGCTKRGLH